MLLAFMVGVICFSVIPPWWHYDEPGHFEYAWLAGHSPTWPVPGQSDNAMRREMAVSMLRYGWYRVRNFKLDLHSSQPIPIGVLQVGDKPGYYFLASLPLRLIPHADITVQYNVARLVSFLLYLLIVAVIWFALGEILPGENPLRWITTVFVAALPAFADTMSSVNNDVSAVLAASLALWACLRLIQRGYSVVNVLFLGASLMACYWSKDTAMFAFGLAPIALILAPLRGRYPALVWSTGGLLLVGLAVITLTWGAPRSWYVEAAGGDPSRVHVEHAPLGKYAFRFSDSAPGAASQMIQIVSPDGLGALKGMTATLGAWMWAGQPTHAGPLFVRFVTRTGDTVDSPQLASDVSTLPAFYLESFSVPADAVNATVYVQQTSHGLPGNNVYFDGLVLAPGQFGEIPPAFADATGTHGIWDGRAFTNALRNPSAEQGSFQIRQRVADLMSRFFGSAGGSLPASLAMIQDWRGTGGYYRDAIATLFRTFWASLAGDKVVVSSYVSDFLVFLTVAGATGALLCLWVRRRSLRWDLVGFLAIALVVPWALALARGSGDFLGGSPLYPWARYAYPAILPTALLLCAGWMQWMDVLAGARRLSDGARTLMVLIIMLAIYSVAILNAARVFHPVRGVGLSALALFLLFLYAIFGLALQQPVRSGD